MRTRNLVVLAVSLCGLFLVWFFYFRVSREEKLIEKGNLIITKIERFKAAFNKLPNSLEDVGLKEELGVDALYYQKKDSINYILSFGTILGESKIYYSDTKTWEDINR